MTNRVTTRMARPLGWVRVKHRDWCQLACLIVLKGLLEVKPEPMDETK